MQVHRINKAAASIAKQAAKDFQEATGKLEMFHYDIVWQFNMFHELVTQAIYTYRQNSNIMTT